MSKKNTVAAPAAAPAKDPVVEAILNNPSLTAEMKASLLLSLNGVPAAAPAPAAPAPAAPAVDPFAGLESLYAPATEAAAASSDEPFDALSYFGLQYSHLVVTEYKTEKGSRTVYIGVSLPHTSPRWAETVNAINTAKTASDKKKAVNALEALKRNAGNVCMVGLGARTTVITRELWAACKIAFAPQLVQWVDAQQKRIPAAK